MMEITRGLAVGVVLAGAAVALAAPASADLTDGTYQANYDVAGSHPWVVTSCGAGCKSIQWDNGEKSGTDTYHLNGNTWTVGAPTGKYNSVKTIDNNTLAGTNEADFMGDHIVERFQLVKNG
jgi:hypothetical protein